MRVKALTKEGIYIYQIPLMITSLCCHIVRNCRNYLHINLLCNAEKARLGYVTLRCRSRSLAAFSITDMEEFLLRYVRLAGTNGSSAC